MFLRAVAMAAAVLPVLASAEPLSFDQALSLAVQRSEAARAGRAAITSANESARAAGQLPDPTLRAGVDNLPATGADRFSTTRDSMTMKRVGISQEWLSADKRAAREGAARAMADREAVQSATAEADARLQVALSYVNAWYAGEALKLTIQTEHHLHEEFEAARARLAAATGASPQVLQLTAARGMAEDESDDARQLQSAAAVNLQRWVGFTPESLSPPPVFVIPPEDDFLARSPSVAGLQRDLEVARRAAAVAAKERTPNWTWDVSYGQRSGYSDMVSVGVSIPLPVAPSQRQDRETAAKLALVEKAEAELAEATRAATADYRALASDAARLQQRVDRYRVAVLVPAQQRIAATLASYRSNQTPLSTLFEARHAEVEAQRRLLALQRDLARAQAQLTFKPLAQGGAQ
ncbi:TolC family protein [Roseateles chitinivorans]|uniref:TolC family protein n=1 Tax=Roseateles chitinivorans TaxID=2917965 RepID=UPI003D672EEB